CSRRTCGDVVCTLRHPAAGPFLRPKARNTYQDDFETPGISPRNARLRKHRRHTPNLRRKARGRPQIWQRLCLRDENFGLRASFTRFAVVAMNSFSSLKLKCQNLNSHARNGMPRCFKSARACSSERAVVTIVTFIPLSLSTFA